MSNDVIIKVFAVIDTNVIISSMIGDKPSSTKKLLNWVEEGNVILLYDQRILDEYIEVLSRFFSESIVKEKLTGIIDNGYLVTDIEETREYFKDKDDIPFFEVKESAKELEPYLVTGNAKHFPEGTTRTATFVVDIMEYLNRFIVKDKKKYLEEFQSFLNNLDKEKYIKNGGVINI